ncbi:MAG: short-subunit dehydrogenase [Halieaceae bacterium]|jgi:short-subunit dehydrogenase
MRILLTGATGGIGQALARAFAAEGFAVLLQGRDRTRLDQLLGQLGDAECEAVVADLCLPEDRDRLLTSAKLFQVNTLCNNAGINSFSPFAETNIEPIVNTNLTATLLLTQGLLPTLRGEKQAHIINIGSAFGAVGFPGYAVYCATKYALRGFSEALSRELADSPVEVHYFSPRATTTGMNTDAAAALNRALGTAADTPESVAAQITRALKKNQRRLQIGRKEAFQARINALFPAVVDRAIASQLPLIKNHFHQEKNHV